MKITTIFVEPISSLRLVQLTFFISLSAGHIREDFGLTHGGFGMVYMIATLGSALTLPGPH